MDQQLLAYLLITVLIVAMAVLVTYNIYHSRDRTYRRRMRQEREARERRLEGWSTKANSRPHRSPCPSDQDDDRAVAN